MLKQPQVEIFLLKNNNYLLKKDLLHSSQNNCLFDIFFLKIIVILEY